VSAMSSLRLLAVPFFRNWHLKQSMYFKWGPFCSHVITKFMSECGSSSY
jgi:hypothetical protein